MPELPDVEIYKRFIDETSLNQRIQSVEVPDTRVLEGISPKKLQQQLKGKSFCQTRRHGKCLFAQLNKSRALLLHFGMTGYLMYTEQSEQNYRHARAIFSFAPDMKLQYVCPRLFGRVSLVESVDNYIREQDLGPDAWNVRLDTLRKILSRSRGSLKSTLMNQNLLAGIGNIYADEILFRSHMLPQTKAKDLDDKQIKQLHRNIQKVLQTAVEKDVDPENVPQTWLLPHRGKNEKCPKCGHPIQIKKISGRTAYFCKNCQS
jgi:formamidopyrimidine-DNA glycosylase